MKLIQSYLDILPRLSGDDKLRVLKEIARLRKLAGEPEMDLDALFPERIPHTERSIVDPIGPERGEDKQ